MQRKKLMITICISIAAVLAVLLLLLFRGRTTEHVYFRSGRRLASKLTAQQAEKYGKELDYTLNKFWEFYEKEKVSRNDLNSVMEKIQRLQAKDELANMDIFNFIGDVSLIYTEVIRKQSRGESGE